MVVSLFCRKFVVPNLMDVCRSPVSPGQRLENIRAFFMPLHKRLTAVVSVTTFTHRGRMFVRFGDHGNDSRFSVYNAKSHEQYERI